MRRSFAVLLALGACQAPVQTPINPFAPETIYVDAGPIAKQIDSIAHVAFVTRKEQSACITKFLELRATGNRIFILQAIGPSTADSTDSLHVYGRPGQALCPRDQPTVHSHAVANSYLRKPSPPDEDYADHWSDAPFQVLISVTDPVHVYAYGVKP